MAVCLCVVSMTAADAARQTEASLLSPSGCPRPLLAAAEKVCCLCLVIVIQKERHIVISLFVNTTSLES